MTSWERASLAPVIFAGIFVGFVELHTTETVATLGLVCAFSVLAGFASSRLFLLWGIIVGGSVPAAYVVAAILRITPRELPQPEGIATDVGVGAFTVAVATIAAAAGAALARLASRST